MQQRQPTIQELVRDTIQLAESGSLDELTLLIDKNPILLNQKDVFGQTPLLLAALNGHLSVVQYLLKQHGIEKNAATKTYDHGGKTALHWAIEKGHPKVAAELINAHASLTEQTTRMQYQPIHIAAMVGDLETLTLLIQSNPELLNQKDMLGQTPLLWAACKGHLHVVNYLLKQKGIELNAATKALDETCEHNGKTALHWATQNNHADVSIALKTMYYDKLYAEQEKNRSWKTKVAITVSILSAGLLAIPAYLIWRYLKREELLQKVEMTPQNNHIEKSKKLEYMKLKPNLTSTDKSTKHKKLMVVQSPEKIVYYMDREQAHRHRFFADCYKNKKKNALTPKERTEQLKLRAKSIQLGSSLESSLRLS